MFRIYFQTLPTLIHSSTFSILKQDEPWPWSSSLPLTGLIFSSPVSAALCFGGGRQMPSGPEFAAGYIWFTKYTKYVYFSCWPSYNEMVTVLPSYNEMVTVFKLSGSLWFGVWLGKGIDQSGDLVT